MRLHADSGVNEVKGNIDTRVEIVCTSAVPQTRYMEINFRTIQKNNIAVIFEWIVPFDPTCTHVYSLLALIGRLLLFREDEDKVALAH